MRAYSLLLLFAWTTAAWGFAQSPPPMVLARLQGPIQLDGPSDEAAWQAVAPLPLTMYLPTFEGTPTEHTEIRIAYDETYLYAAGRFYDSDPTGIRINSLYRDRWSGDDAFALFIDTFNDNENALWFMTTPAGIRADFALSNDGEGRNAINGSWNTFWDVATQVTPEGWFAEVRIPLSSLRFQEIDGQVVMGLTATRYIARKNERVTFPAISPRYPFRKPSVAQDVVLRGIHPHTPLYVTPYVLGGSRQAATLNPAQTRYRQEVAFQREVGLDARYSLTPNLTLDLTVNTDFAQVEADDQQINLTRFSLFFPEKRQFFQERAALFSFATGDGNRLLHTRRIGLRHGEPLRILGGARLVGRIGAWDVGLLNMQTGRHGRVAPSENFGVLRLRRQVLNPYSYAGAMVTSRIGGQGNYNLAYGLDGVVRLFGDDYLTMKWAQSLDQAFLDTLGFRPFETGQAYLSWERRSNEGWEYEVQASRAGASYNPGIGFVRRPGYTYFNGVLSYNLLLPHHPVLRTHSWNQITFARIRQSDGHLESLYVAPWWEFETKAGTSGWIEPRFFYEDVAVPFSLSGKADVEAGRYAYFDLWLNYKMPLAALFSTNTHLITGGFYDGWRITASTAPTWRASRYIEFGGAYEFDYLRFPEREQALTSHVIRFRIRTALNARFSAQAYVQYSNTAHALGLNTILRYNFAEGTDLWLVYNHNLNTHRDRFAPTLPITASQVLVFKYTYTLAL